MASGNWPLLGLKHNCRRPTDPQRGLILANSASPRSYIQGLITSLLRSRSAASVAGVAHVGVLSFLVVRGVGTAAVSGYLPAFARSLLCTFGHVKILPRFRLGNTDDRTARTGCVTLHICPPLTVVPARARERHPGDDCTARGCTGRSLVHTQTWPWVDLVPSPAVRLSLCRRYLMMHCTAC